MKVKTPAIDNPFTLLTNADMAEAVEALRESMAPAGLTESQTALLEAVAYRLVRTPEGAQFKK